MGHGFQFAVNRLRWRMMDDASVSPCSWATVQDALKKMRGSERMRGTGAGDLQWKLEIPAIKHRG